MTKPRTQTLVYAQNTGGVNFRANEALVNDSPQGTQMGLILNYETYREGGFQPQKGNEKLLTTVSDATAVLGVGEYRDDAGSYWAIYLKASGNAYVVAMDGAAEGSPIKTGLSTTATPCFVQYGSSVVVFNGADAPWHWNGTAAANLTGTPAAWATTKPHIACNLRAGRILAAAGSALFHNALGDLNDWTTASDAGNFEDIFNNTADVVALREYGSRVNIHTTNNRIYVLTGSGPDDYQISPIATNRSAVGNQGLATIDDNQFFFSGDQILPVATTDLGVVKLGKGNDISALISPFFTGSVTDLPINSVNQDEAHKTLLLPYNKKNELVVYACTGTSTAYNMAAIFSFNSMSWVFRQATTVTSAAVVDDEIVTGTADGNVLVEFRGDSLHNSADFVKTIISPWFQFGSPTYRKSIERVFLWFNSTTDIDVTLTFNTDYNPEIAFSQTVSVGNISSGASYGEGSYDVDHYAAVSVLDTEFKPDNMWFRNCRFTLQTSNSSQVVRLIKYAFVVEGGDDF